MLIVTFLVTGTHVIGIKCKDTGGQAMTLASFSNGQVTDGSWKCSRTYEDGWSSPYFDDSTWDKAFEIAPNVAKTWPWHQIPGISASAKYIWLKKWNNVGKHTVYCRKVINPPPGKSQFSQLIKYCFEFNYASTKCLEAYMFSSGLSIHVSIRP